MFQVANERRIMNLLPLICIFEMGNNEFNWSGLIHIIRNSYQSSEPSTEGQNPLKTALPDLCCRVQVQI